MFSHQIVQFIKLRSFVFWRQILFTHQIHSLHPNNPLLSFHPQGADCIVSPKLFVSLSRTIVQLANEHRPTRSTVHEFQPSRQCFQLWGNVLLEFYAPWCCHCKNLAPILDEVVVSLESDADVVIAKIDATANDVPIDIFDVKGYPTLYFKSAGGNLLQYNGERTKEDTIDFI